MEKVKCVHCGTDNPVRYRYCNNCGYELPKIVIGNFDNPIQQSNTIKTNKRKQTLAFIIGAIFFGFSYFAVQQLFFKAPSIDKVLMNTASEINKTCPVMVDEFTRLDNAIALPNSTFQYNYSIINHDKTEMNLDTAKKYIEPVLLNKVKTDPDLKYFRDNDVILVYNYRDKNGVFVVKYSITPDMYNKE
jgi:hypothetical protein